jgi:hypothetical protein
VLQGVSNSVESSTVPVMGRKLEIIVVIDTDYILRRHITNYMINYRITNYGQLSTNQIYTFELSKEMSRQRFRLLRDI